MELDDALGTAGPVQPVDVLGDDAAEQPAALELGDGPVAGVRRGPRDDLPPRWLRAQYRRRATGSRVKT